MPDLPEPRIAVLVPCYNESVSIGAVVRDFREALPQARIFIYDNNSTDDTVAVARAAGAVVRREPLQGKGNVVRRMFGDIGICCAPASTSSPASQRTSASGVSSTTASALEYS